MARRPPRFLDIVSGARFAGELSYGLFPRPTHGMDGTGWHGAARALSRYDRLPSEDRSTATYHYGTTIGGALPVISTLQVRKP